MAGCAGKPAPPPPPSPMTADYLLEHMNVKQQPAFHLTTVSPLPLVRRIRFHDGNATLTVRLVAQVDTAERNNTPPCTPIGYQIVFGLKAPVWGEFDAAYDTLGNLLAVKPYRSTIRGGVFYDSFYVNLPKTWLDKAGRDNTELLLVNRSHELGVTVPSVYPEALRRYLDLYLSLHDPECK